MANPTDPKKLSKAQQVEKLLKRSRGATMSELITETSWQAHSVRAFLTGLRKTGHTISKEERKPGVVAYRIGAQGAEPAPHSKEPSTGDSSGANA